MTGAKNFQPIIICILLFVAAAVCAQEPDLSKISDPKDKAAAWIAYCESLRLNSNNAKNNFVTLESAALRGLSLVPSTEGVSRSRLLFYAGIGTYYQVKFDSAQYYFYRSLAEAQRVGSAEMIVNSCVALIPVNFQLREQPKVDSCKALLQSIIDTTRVPKMLQDGYAALGTYYQQKSYYGTAQDYFLKGVELRKKVVDTTSDMRLRGDFAIQCYLLSKQYQNTEVLDKSLAVLREGSAFASASPLVSVRYLSAFTEIFSLLGNIDSARIYAAKLVKATAGSPTIPSELVAANTNIAKYYLDRHQTASALPFVQAADSLATTSKSMMLIYEGQMVHGRYDLQTGHYQDAAALLEKALPVAKQISRENYVEGLKNLAAAEKAMGHFDKAWAVNEQYIAETDSLTKEKISLNFADQETRYQTNQKQLRILSLDKENRLQVLELQSASHTRLFLILGLVALGIISLLLYFIYRNKENLNNLLTRKNDQLGKLNNDLAVANDTKAKLFGIISHDLRAPVGKIVQLLRLQKENPGMLSEDSRIRHEQNLKTASENVLETMEDLLIWSKTQMQQFTPQPKDVRPAELVKKETAMLATTAEEKNISFSVNVPAALVRYCDDNMLSVILRNLLQNAVKYGEAGGCIDIDGDNESIRITNSASRVDAAALNALVQNKAVSASSSGLGLQIAGELATRIGASLSFRQNGDNKLSTIIAWIS